ncbi:hypothetical protein FB451DRAFT_1391162 [Mycena latifolia]|nr:hypothetical protein FB451DRAFT_1391162 [Mycena latifolia]
MIGFGDIVHVVDPCNSCFFTLLMGSLIGLIVHIFFACCIVAVSRAAWPLAVLVVLISMAQCTGGMGIGILAYIAPGVHDQKYTALAYTWLIGRAVADALIAGIMIAFVSNPSVLPVRLIIIPARSSQTRSSRVLPQLLPSASLLSALVSVVGLVLFLGVPYLLRLPTMILPGISANTLPISLITGPVVRAADSMPLVYSVRVGSARVLNKNDSISSSAYWLYATQ